MKRSTERILTTHTGSLPRPADLVELLQAQEAGARRPTPSAFAARVRRRGRGRAAADRDGHRRRQRRRAGQARLLHVRQGPAHRLRRAEPGARPSGPRRGTSRSTGRAAPGARARPSRGPPATARSSGRTSRAVQRDIANLQAAAAAVRGHRGVHDAPPRPASIVDLPRATSYYPSREAYLDALADVMKDEYEAIHARRLRAPARLPRPGDGPPQPLPRPEPRGVPEDRRRCTSRRSTTRHADIPPERMRLHLCWGNYEGPHHRDIPLRDIIDLVLRARPAGLSFEGANPRHEHEWAVWKEVKLPDGKVLIPGVIDSTTNFIEHPELVAQRIVRYASVVGRERVIAGTRLRLRHLRRQRRRRPAHRLGEARGRWRRGRGWPRQRRAVGAARGDRREDGRAVTRRRRASSAAAMPPGDGCPRPRRAPRYLAILNALRAEIAVAPPNTCFRRSRRSPVASG